MKRLGLLALILALLIGFEPGSVISPAFGGILRDAIALEQSWSRAERQDVQDALIWSGDYAGRLDGDFGPGTRGSIEAFQTRNGFWSTGHLTEAELAALKRQRRAAISAAGFTVRAFPGLGLSIGLPEALLGTPVAQTFGLEFSARRAGGLTALTLFSGPAGSGEDFRDLYDTAVARDTFNRDVYEVFRDDWFVFTGTSDNGLKQYSYMRKTGNGVRGFAFHYATGDADRLDWIAVAMFNSLDTYVARGGTRDGALPRFMPPETSPSTSSAEPPVAALPRGGTGSAAGDRPRKVSTSDHGGERVAIREPEPHLEPEVEPRAEPAVEPGAEPGVGYGTDRKGQTPGRRPRRESRPPPKFRRLRAGWSPRAAAFMSTLRARF